MHRHGNPNRDFGLSSHRKAALRMKAGSPDDFGRPRIWQNPRAHVMFYFAHYEYKLPSA
jgi:hypothetical protein